MRCSQRKGRQYKVLEQGAMGPVMCSVLREGWVTLRVIVTAPRRRRTALK